MERLNIDRMGLKNGTGAQDKCRMPKILLMKVGRVQKSTTQKRWKPETGESQGPESRQIATSVEIRKIKPWTCPLP